MEWIGDLERAFSAAIHPNRVMVAIALTVLLVAVALIAKRRGWYRAARRHPGRTAAILVLALAIALPLGWYLGSPLVLSNTVDEPAPIVWGPSRSAALPPPRRHHRFDSGSLAIARPIREVGLVPRRRRVPFGRGTAHLIETAPGVFVVRLEDFAVRNGPDLLVYLSPTADGYAEGAVELAPLKGDNGNQNYEVPAGIDPTAAGSVVIWCKQFSVLFATAPLDS